MIIIALSAGLFILVLGESQDGRSAFAIVDGKVEITFLALTGLLIFLTEGLGLEASVVYYYFV